MQCFREGYRGICHASLVLYMYRRDGSQELKSFGAGFWRSPQRYPSKVLRASYDGILPQNMQRQSWPLIGSISQGMG